jgi:hypothetical protein
MPIFRRRTVSRSQNVGNSLNLNFKTLAKAKFKQNILKMKEESQLEAVSDFTEETVNVVASAVILFWCIIYINVFDRFHSVVL